MQLTLQVEQKRADGWADSVKWQIIRKKHITYRHNDASDLFRLCKNADSVGIKGLRNKRDCISLVSRDLTVIGDYDAYLFQWEHV